MLDQLQVSTRAVLEQTKQLLCPSALAVPPGDAGAGVMLHPAQCLFWVQGSVRRDPLWTQAAGNSQGTLLPAVCAVPGQRRCPAAGGERCQRALPSLRSHAAGTGGPARLCPCAGNAHLYPHRRAPRGPLPPSSLLPYGKNRSVSSACFILLVMEAAAALSWWWGKASLVFCDLHTFLLKSWSLLSNTSLFK